MARRHAAAAALFAALSIAITWPLLPNLGSAVAYPGDPLINTWILDWDWYATFHRPAHLFDGNIFYPAKRSLAFSENLYGIALLLMPLRAAGVSAVAAYNIAMLLGYTACGFFAYLLAFELTADTWAAAVAGIFYAFVPFRFTHASHVQYVFAGTLPLLLLCLIRYARQPDARRAAACGAAYLWNGLTNVHFFLFGGVALVMTVALLRPPLRRLSLSLAAAMLLLLPFLLPYRTASRLYGMERSYGETMTHSAVPSDWLLDNFTHRFYPTKSDPAVDPERWLFPGATVLLMSGIALLSRRWRDVTLAGSWVALGFVGSLGLRTPFHRLLFDYAPGFRAIRVPARWAVIAHVGLAILAAIGTATLARRRRWIAPLVAIAFFAELYAAAPMRWFLVPRAERPIDIALRHTQLKAIAELPLSNQDTEYEVMLHATAHHRRVVNGVSGFAPPEYRRLVDLNAAWSDELVPELARIGVSHVVVRADELDDAGRSWLGRMVDRGELGLVRRFDGGINGHWLFRVGARGDAVALRTMLAGHATYNEATFGALLEPSMRAIPHTALFSGIALSSYGVRSVTLRFNNGAVRIPAQLVADSATSRWYRWYDATPRPRFVARFATPPAAVRGATDVQVEILDGRGHRTLLPDRWIDWQ
jgi:hypothetical protein